MKNILLILLIGIIFKFSLSAKKVEGYYITNESTKVNVDIDVPLSKNAKQQPNYLKIRYKIEYYDSSGNKNVLKPENISEFGFILNGKKSG